MNNTSIRETSRDIEWTNEATLDTQIAYFNPGELNYIISTQREGVAKTYSGTVPLKAKTWHKLTVKASLSHGQLDINVTADDTVADEPGVIEVNPYQQ